MQDSFNLKMLHVLKMFVLQPRVQEEFLRSVLKYKRPGLKQNSRFYKNVIEEKEYLSQKVDAYKEKHNLKDFNRKDPAAIKLTGNRCVDAIKMMDADVYKWLRRKMVSGFEDPAKIPKTCWGHFAQFVKDNIVLFVLILYVVAAITLFQLNPASVVNSIAFTMLISVPIIIGLYLFDKVLNIFVTYLFYND
ncbi:hypothetical protein C922_04602 [Plasmodium inui San Antonio 1]|uniref:Uncharacterized protein n=1 Tax=Plasmodium inui San Antonio 1 TaxID=1237626 RepID=W7A767_9APIC|nr:hypothetical protein C922_04602 [Plasmodium inui San Antonio 1]EUD64974.1 hypothetical protein C922_04602 [Plasmodium inui San Antonio 1]